MIVARGVCDHDQQQKHNMKWKKPGFWDFWFSKFGIPSFGARKCKFETIQRGSLAPGGPGGDIGFSNRFRLPSSHCISSRLDSQSFIAKAEDVGLTARHCWLFRWTICLVWNGENNQKSIFAFFTNRLHIFELLFGVRVPGTRALLQIGRWAVFGGQTQLIRAYLTLCCISPSLKSGNSNDFIF